MATGSVSTNNNSVQLTSFQNGWSANGMCFFKRIGDMCTLHISIRNGTTTDNTKILSLSAVAPAETVLAPIFHISGSGTMNGYLSVATNGDITIKNLTGANIYADFSWQIKSTLL